jgi:cytochrome c oxidase accessory protein FixG
MASVSETRVSRRTAFGAKSPIVPKAVTGPVRRAKWIVLIVLLGIYWIAPWIRWDRGAHAPDQAFLIDLAHGKAYFLFFEIWPQEVYVVTGILIMMAVGLFLLTALFGRVWCGFACPQTVWTDLYMLVERWIEGDRARRLRLDAAPWTASKIAKRVAKHAAWIVIAVLTGGAWVLYFNDAPTVMGEILTGTAGVGVYATIALLTGTTYVLAGWARETVCTFMCPYARFQGAMMDPDTVSVSYRAWRGEPRGKRKPGESRPGQGDCIDCRQCVEVCPTGIDIRNGLQVSCINCGLCIDACNAIMDRMGSPAGLIAFDTERNLAASAEGGHAPRRYIRVRTMLYATVYALVGLAILYALLTRTPLEASALPDRNPLFVTLSDGSIRNGYTLKLLNRTQKPQTVVIGHHGLPGAEIAFVGTDDRGGRAVTVAPDSVASLRAYVTVPQSAWTGGPVDFEFELESAGGDYRATAPARFEGP